MEAAPDLLDAPADRPLILLCNDDGIDAAGIVALAHVRGWTEE